MTVTQNLFKKSASFTPSSLQKLLKSYKTLTKSQPKHWSNIQFRSNPDVEFNFEIKNDLNLNHPILRKLESCSNVAQFNQVQAQLIIFGIFQHSLSASRVIKKLCSLPRGLKLAVSLLKNIENPDAFMCNTVIRSYWDKGYSKDALNFYYSYVVFGCVVHNHYTFPLIIKLCIDLGSILEGEKTHCRVLKCGFPADLFVKNSLILMYSALGKVGSAEKVFGESSESDLVTWNTMIDGYVKNGQVVLARNLFDEMRVRDEFTWNSMIAGYVGVRDMEAAIELFGTMPHRDIVSWNSLLDGCAKIGDKLAARECFNRMPKRNVVSWNIMLALYVRCKDYDECLRLFDRMIEDEDIQPNEATLVSVLTACGYLGMLDKGKWVHSYIVSKKRMKPDVLLYTALLTMYTKCGDMDTARSTFDIMPKKSVVSWNSMIMGYGSHGLIDNALDLFSKMERSGQEPNDATFTCVLAACAHSSRVLEGWWYFHVMHRVYQNDPKVEHYGCMADLLSKSNLVKDFERLEKEIPKEEGSVSWRAVLFACQVHSNSQLGEVVGKWLIEKDPEDIAPYLLLSNIFASERRWEDVDGVRRLMKEKGLHKYAPANSLTDCQIHRKGMIASMLLRLGSELKMSRS
ncbi:pentatricopeptide repeat-containing protein At4g18840-like [Silene latifolia]|uniref:pentatricopeptide repeat-containing protein At4g18840-like n=1 Tax=Silene latifolia TaxID=37657 RepID=UPI003D7864CC